MSTKAKTLIAIIVLGVLDAVIPGVPVLALVLVYAILNKPRWFIDVAGELCARPVELGQNDKKPPPQ